MDAAQQEFMVGTEGTHDYLVISDTDTLKIGFKPVIEVTYADSMPHGGMIIGARVRVASNESVPLVDVGHAAVTAFPEFTFNKNDKSRASSFIGSLVPAFPEGTKIEDVLAKMEDSNFFTTIVAHLQPLLAGSNPRYTPEELTAFLKESLSEKMPSFLPKPTAGSLGKVISFPTKK